MATPDEEEEAARIDRLAGDQLRQAMLRSNAPMVTEESIRAGDIYMQQVQRDHDALVLKRIESKALITAGELQDALNVPPESLGAALQDQRLFTIESPAGGAYFPSFYAEPERYDLGALGRVSQALGNLPAASKYHFFTSRWIPLLSRTPLQAIADGDVEKVLITAAGFAEY
jgi:hypothetical protein